MWKWLIAEFTRPECRHGVDDDLFWNAARVGTNAEVFDALQDFGKLMVAEAQARTAILDSKATNLLGWNATASGFLLTVLLRFEPESALRWLFVVGAILTGLGTVFAFVALRVRGVMIPSEEEWLEPELTAAGNLFEIRRLHLLLMLRWHRSDCDVNANKGHWAKLAQWCLVIAAIILPLAVLLVALPGAAADLVALLVHDVVSWRRS
jgi:hypothetical protein